MTRKLTKEEFIIKAKKVHGNKYGYDNVDYKNNSTNVIITCIEGGHEFYQRPNNHLSGACCPVCEGNQKSNTDEFIIKAKKVHNDKYGYDKVKYIGALTKVKISCIEDGHSDFEQTPGSHLSGRGCPICAGKQKSNTEEFIIKAKKVHNDKYGYDKVVYVDVKTKVKIICIEGGHEFDQIPYDHLSGHGCGICAGNKKSNTEEFIIKAKKVHNDKYGYGKVKYKGSEIIVEINCFKPEHGVFEQTPGSHLSGRGCPICANNQKSNTEEFIIKAKKVHKDKYGYENVIYNGCEINVEIRCLKEGHYFDQTPHKHLSGRGCSKCNYRGYSKVSISFLETFPHRIIHAKNEGEKYIKTEKKKYKADGYFKASKQEEIDDIFRHCHHLYRFRNPNSLEVVIEFHGCFWHGCEMCYTERDEINSVSDKTFEELYKATNRKKMSLIKAGYNYIEIWECQYKTLIEGYIKG